MNYFEAVDYCETTHGATLPIFQTKMGPNHLTVDQEVYLGRKLLMHLMIWHIPQFTKKLDFYWMSFSTTIMSASKFVEVLVWAA